LISAAKSAIKHKQRRNRMCLKVERVIYSSRFVVKLGITTEIDGYHICTCTWCLECKP
jgi:hypothetical protein